VINTTPTSTTATTTPTIKSTPTTQTTTTSTTTTTTSTTTTTTTSTTTGEDSFPTENQTNKPVERQTTETIIPEEQTTKVEDIIRDEFDGSGSGEGLLINDIGPASSTTSTTKTTTTTSSEEQTNEQTTTSESEDITTTTTTKSTPTTTTTSTSNTTTMKVQPSTPGKIDLECEPLSLPEKFHSFNFQPATNQADCSWDFFRCSLSAECCRQRYERCTSQVARRTQEKPPKFIWKYSF